MKQKLLALALAALLLCTAGCSAASSISINSEAPTPTPTLTETLTPMQTSTHVPIVTPDGFTEFNHTGSREDFPFLPIINPASNVPDFLDEDQQDLYRQASLIYGLIAGSPSAINMIIADGNLDYAPFLDEPVRMGHIHYYPATGYYQTWSDFEAMYLSLFTEEFYQASILDENVFISLNNRLFYAATDSGSNFGYEPREMPDKFELVSKTDDYIEFILIGHYYLSGYEEGVERTEYETAEFTISMENTSYGWRFSQFADAANSIYYRDE